MIVAKLKIDKVVDVDQILNKVVKEKKNVDLSTFYKRKISAVDKEIYIYSFECVVVKNSIRENAYSLECSYVRIPFCATFTIIASVKTDSVAMDVVFPSDDKSHDNPPSNSIIDGLKKEGFKVLKYTGYNNI